MRRNGSEFISASETPRRFTELLAERPEPPLEDPDEIPAPPATWPPLQTRANRGRGDAR